MKNKKILICAVLSVAGMQPVLACDLCSVYSAREAQGGGRGFFGGVAGQFTYFGTLQKDGQKEAANGEYIDSAVSQIFAGYNFNGRLGVQFNLPVIFRAYGSATAHGNESGIGDATLAGNFLVYEKSTDDF